MFPNNLFIYKPFSQKKSHGNGGGAVYTDLTTHGQQESYPNVVVSSLEKTHVWSSLREHTHLDRGLLWWWRYEIMTDNSDLWKIMQLVYIYIYIYIYIYCYKLRWCQNMQIYLLHKIFFHISQDLSAPHWK